MPFSSNFVRVSLGRDENGKKVVFVDGKSKQPQNVKAIYVALAHGDEMEPAAVSVNGSGTSTPNGQIHSVAAADAPAGADWKATLPQRTPNVKVGEKVVIVGVAMPKSGALPFFWHETVTAVTAQAVPK